MRGAGRSRGRAGRHEGRGLNLGPLAKRRLAKTCTNQQCSPCRSACCDCPSSSAIDSAPIKQTKTTEMPRAPAEPVEAVGGLPGMGPPTGSTGTDQPAAWERAKVNFCRKQLKFIRHEICQLQPLSFERPKPPSQVKIYLPK